jgi:hypothetical protein
MIVLYNKPPPKGNRELPTRMLRIAIYRLESTLFGIFAFSLIS